MARPSRMEGLLSGPVAADRQPAAIHVVSPSVPTSGSALKVKLRMRGQTKRHCSGRLAHLPVDGKNMRA